MSRTKTLSLKCPSCRKQIALPVYESITLSEDPQLRAPLLNGQLNYFRCDNCGANFPLPQPLLCHDALRRTMIYFLPQQDVLDLSKRSELSEPYCALKKSGYVFRLVRSFNDLREKIFAAEQGLDDYTLELYKFMIKLKLESQDKLTATHIYFDAAECTPFVYGSLASQRGNILAELLKQNPMPHFVILFGKKLGKMIFDPAMYAEITRQFSAHLREAWNLEAKRNDWPLIDETWAKKTVQSL